MREYEGYMELPLSIGVYLLLSGDCVVYVGQSKNVYARVEAHRRTPVFEFDKVLFKQCDIGALDKLEAEAISKYNPRHNKIIPQPIPVCNITVDLSKLTKYWLLEDGRRCR